MSPSPDGTFLVTFTPHAPQSYHVLVHADTLLLADWCIEVPSPATPAPAIPAEIPHSPSSSSSSSSSQEANEKENAGVISSVSPVHSEIAPQISKLGQYEQASFRVVLLDGNRDNVSNATLSTYPTDQDENDYSEVFQWTATEKEPGVWEVTFTPDRPGAFIAVVAANDILLGQWGFEVTAGTPHIFLKIC